MACTGHVAVPCTCQSVTCVCNAYNGSNWACTCNSQGGSNWWTCVHVYDSFYLINDACPANQTTWTESLNTNIKIKASHINELRAAINSEQTRRHTSPYSFGSAESTSTTVTQQDTKDLSDQIEALIPFTGTWAYNYSLISKIEAAILIEVRANLNDAENDCLCNCNYCTCQCNYCTCNCNYCTCQCNYCTCNCNYCTCNCNYCTCNCNYACTCNCNYACTCNCNYACTCNCNYSDERLKENIHYM
jgi:hypothetical protein